MLLLQPHLRRHLRVLVLELVLEVHEVDLNLLRQRLQDLVMHLPPHRVAGNHQIQIDYHHQVHLARIML